MDFPKTETDVMAFSKRMIDGYFWRPADFPHINRMLLYIKRAAYADARKKHIQANAALRIAAKATEKKLSELVKVMKICLQKSEVDVASNPEKLKLIGWGPRTEPQPAQLPTQPLNLQIVAKENQIVKLKWDRPAGNLPVRNYIIECRKQTSEGLSGWTIVQISYNTEVTLNKQPLGIQLEYRIRAANNAGTSLFSNTVSIIL